jgi:hypothetical protein
VSPYMYSLNVWYYYALELSRFHGLFFKTHVHLYLWLLRISCEIVNSLYKLAFWYCEKCSTDSNHSKSITIKSSSHLPYFLDEKFTSSNNPMLLCLIWKRERERERKLFNFHFNLKSWALAMSSWNLTFLRAFLIMIIIIPTHSTN